MKPDPVDILPDIRDGLTRKRRIILYCLDQIQKERDGRDVPTTMLYGRVVEYIDMSIGEFQEIIANIAEEN